MKYFVFIQRYFNSLLENRTSGKEEQIRLAVYLMACTMSILGSFLHFFGAIGVVEWPLLMVSVLFFLTTILFLMLFLTRKMTLSQSFFWGCVTAQVLTGFRVVYLSIARPEGALMALLLNSMVTFLILLLLFMGSIRKAPVIVIVLGLGTFIAAHIISPQLVPVPVISILIFLELSIFFYFLFMNRFVGDSFKILALYKSQLTTVLDFFNMSKEEMVTLIQLCRHQGSYEESMDMMNQNLSLRTKRNLIRVGEYLQEQKEDYIEELGKRFPELSNTELEVCQLLLKGMTSKEIATSLGKNLSNIGTVRGNIRRKLNLDLDVDLKDYLSKLMK